MKEKTMSEKWVEAMKATRDKYDEWLRNPDKRGEIGYTIGVVSKCAMCRTSTEVMGYDEIDNYCGVCPVAVGVSSVKCLGSCCYPHGKLTVEMVRLRKQYYNEILERFADDDSKAYGRLCEIVFEVEEEFKLKTKED
jgi:hypothetical protein